MMSELRIPTLSWVLPGTLRASYELSQDLHCHVSGGICKGLLHGIKRRFSRETHENFPMVAQRPELNK